jgi:predicted DNA-binding antitoxin AbrB/MazE fold protein
MAVSIPNGGYTTMLKQQVDAIYENGVLKPLTPVDLAEHERVSLVIRAKGDDDEDEDADSDDYMPLIAEEGDPNIRWEEVQRITAKWPGSFAEDIDHEREERF